MKELLKNPKIQLVLAALVLLFVGHQAGIDIPAMLQSLEAIAESLGELTGMGEESGSLDDIEPLSDA